MVAAELVAAWVVLSFGTLGYLVGQLLLGIGFGVMAVALVVAAAWALQSGPAQPRSQGDEPPSPR